MDNKNKILVVAVHPDDETLGCGGTLLKHQYEGDEINWLICTELKLKDGFSQSKIDEQNNQIKQAQELYKFSAIHRLELSTMRVDTYTMSELIDKISKIINSIKPQIIYLPFKSDVHSDHRKIFEAVYSCTKSFRYPFIKRILMMETLSETEFSPSLKEDSFVPNVFVDISDFFQKKIEIMQCFKSEVGEHPFPRSLKNIQALHTYRGASSGCEYAEAFMLLKEIV